MKMKCSNRVSSFILCMVLIVAMALFMTGCNDSTGSGDSVGSSTTAEDAGGVSASTAAEDAGSQTERKQLGEGTFLFTVVDQDGGETVFEIHTDKDTVGAALQELELIAGEEGQYGLYVKTVNGITADYDKDGTYWAFYVNGEYASVSVDATAITEGDSYSFKVE